MTILTLDQSNALLELVQSFANADVDNPGDVQDFIEESHELLRKMKLPAMAQDMTEGEALLEETLRRVRSLSKKAGHLVSWKPRKKHQSIMSSEPRKADRMMWSVTGLKTVMDYEDWGFTEDTAKYIAGADPRFLFELANHLLGVEKS